MSNIRWIWARSPVIEELHGGRRGTFAADCLEPVVLTILILDSGNRLGDEEFFMLSDGLGVEGTFILIVDGVCVERWEKYSSDVCGWMTCRATERYKINKPWLSDA